MGMELAASNLLLLCSLSAQFLSTCSRRGTASGSLVLVRASNDISVLTIVEKARTSYCGLLLVESAVFRQLFSIVY